MQNLLKLAEQLKKQVPKPTDMQIVNLIREYLQVIILKSIYHSKYAGSLSFMGGTLLRICYNLKRFSEDMDFALDRHAMDYSFSRLLATIHKDIDLQGYTVDISRSGEKIVQKAFVEFSNILHPSGLSHRESQKIHIKIEVDTNPVKVSDSQMESFFVTKFDEVFPILKHKIETSFAGKILAILGRTYTKGRDHYDLIWFLSRKTDVDMEYLNAGVRQLRMTPFKNRAEVFEHLSGVVKKTRTEPILKDIGKFLEDPAEQEWLTSYHAVFNQLAADYLKK